MADYTLAVSWSGKDALADSDANKVISGADFNSEFTTIQTAINSKADIASETLTGTPIAPTAAVATNSTQIATTAFVRAEIANRAYPVGAIFTTVTAYADSAAVVAVIGGTTWTAFGAGKVLVGVDTGDSDFNTIEETGGAKTGSHTLTVAELPAHTHSYDRQVLTSDSLSIHDTSRVTGGNSSATSGSTGSGSAHTHPIVQPYITVYFWKRTA
jgi:hypothetical protein